MKKFALSALMSFLLISQCFAGNYIVPKQEILGLNAPAELGELIDLSVSPIADKEKPQDLVSVQYDWKLYEVVVNAKTKQYEFKEKRFRQNEKGDTISFGSGVVSRRFFVEVYVAYLFAPKNDKGQVTEAAVRTTRLFGYLDVGAPAPAPVPDPTPDPKPDPKPEPKDVIPANGLSAVVIYESAERTKLPPGQVAAMYSSIVREYTNAKFTGGFRVFDQNDDVSKEAEFFRVAMQRPRHSLPHIVISDGRGNQFEGPLPDSVTKLLDLLKKYGN